MFNETQDPFSDKFIPADTQKLLARLLATGEAKRQERQAFMANQPQEIVCECHPHVIRKLTDDATQRRTCAAGGLLTAGYEPCPECELTKRIEREREWLIDAGVPANMVHCTFDNWNATTVEEQGALKSVIEFSKRKAGFLVMLGGFGTGKSHLAIGVLRLAGSGAFIKQNTLLRELRESYRDRNAKDPVKRLQHARVLVLDEVGVSTGGRDELPTLHEILDYRHGEKLPTVLTSNLTWLEFKAAVGDRLADRLKESAFKILTFSGQSHRADRKADYFSEV